MINEPGPTGEPAATEPPLEAGAEANAKPAVLPGLPDGLPEAGVELAAAFVEAPPAATPEHDGDTRRKAGYAVLLLTFAVALLGTARLLAERQ